MRHAKVIIRIKDNALRTAAADALRRRHHAEILHFAEAPAFADLRGTRERGQADLKSLVARIYVTPQPGVIPGMSIGVKIND